MKFVLSEVLRRPPSPDPDPDPNSDPEAEDYLDRGSSFRRSEGSDGSAVSIPAHRHDPSVYLQGAAPGAAIATTQHGLCLPTEGSAGPAASISAHCHVPSIYPKGATRGAEIGATGRCLSLGRPKGCVGAEDFISATSGFPDESIEGCLAATSSVKIKRHSVFRHSKMLAMMAFLIVLNFLPMGDALLRSTHPTPPSKTDYCNDVTCEEYDENYCDSYDTEDSTSTDTSPNKDAECFCCGSEPTVTCNATAGELKNVVEKYVDDIGVILEEGIIEKKIITAYPHCSSEYLQELLLNDTTVDHEIEALIGNATLNYTLNRIHDASISIEREVNEEDVDIDEALEHVGMTEQEIDILLENYGNKDEKERISQAKSKKVKDLKVKSEKVRKNFEEITGKEEGKKKQSKEKGNSSGKPKKVKNEDSKTKPPLMRYVNKKSASIKMKSEIQPSVPRRLIPSEFDRLKNHMVRLKRSIPMNSAFLLNRLQEEIGNCTTNLDCAASELEDIVDKVDTVSTSVLAELSPLEELLGNIDSLGDALATGTTILKGIIGALSVLQYMPGFLGPIIKTVYKTVKPIGNMLTKAAGKANDFITKIAGHWEKGIGKLLIVLESIDLIMGSSSGAARFVADITQSVCAREASTALIGTDIFKPIEDAAPTLLSFARNFKESLFSLSKALLSEAWKQINDTLQKIVDDSKGVVDALNPLKPLEQLMKKEIEIPWIEFPYFIEKVGASHCQTSSSIGYSSYKGTLSWDTCWEHTPRFWHVPLINQYSFKKNCDDPVLDNGSWWGKCYNENYGRSKKYWPANNEWGWCSWTPCRKSWCSKQYGSGWERYYDQRHCIQNCPSHKLTSGDYCYDKSCPADYSTAESGKFCIGNTRSIKSHPTVCDNHQSSDGIPIGPSFGWQGAGCYKECKIGFSETLGFCVPDSLIVKLRTSVSGIIDAFNDVIEFIQDLPILDVILAAIDAVLDPIFGFVGEKIQQGLASLGITLPDFPTIDLDMLPFPEDLELPELPDVSKMLDFPKTFMEDTMAKIPLPDNMKKCLTPSEPYIDMKCMIDATGLETMIDFAQTIQGVAENMVPALTDSLSSFFNVVSCTQETNFTLPVRQSVLDTLGIDLGTSCDQQISVCTAVDFGDIDIIGEIFHEVEEDFQPVLNIMEKMLHPSHINGTPNLEAPLPLLPNPLPLFTLSGDLSKGTLTRESGLVNGGVMKDLTFLIPQTGNGSYDPGRKDTSKEDAVKDVTDFSVLGLHVRLNINLAFDFDWKSDWKKVPFQEKFGFSFTPAFLLEFQYITGAHKVLESIIEEGNKTAWDVNSGDTKSIWKGRGTEKCWDASKTETRTEYPGDFPIRKFRKFSMLYEDKCSGFSLQELEDACACVYKAEDILFETKRNDCSLEKMTQRLAEDKMTNALVEYTKKCLDYWKGDEKKKSEGMMDKAHGYTSQFAEFITKLYTTKPPTKSPTKSPTRPPTKSPTMHPTKSPTRPPTKSPTMHPTKLPTMPPTKSPTMHPTKLPTMPPTKSPTMHPTKSPTKTPPENFGDKSKSMSSLHTFASGAVAPKYHRVTLVSKTPALTKTVFSSSVSSSSSSSRLGDVKELEDAKSRIALDLKESELSLSDSISSSSYWQILVGVLKTWVVNVGVRTKPWFEYLFPDLKCNNARGNLVQVGFQFGDNPFYPVFGIIDWRRIWDDNHNDDKGATKLNIGCDINFSFNDLSLGSLYTLWSEGWRTLAKFKVIVSVQSPTIRLMPWCKNSFRDLIVPSYDIGDVGLKGSATKDSCSGSWKVLGSGTGLSSEKDEFQYTYFKESRDVDISVRLDSFNATKPSAKAGIMIRQSLEPGSKHYSILLNITSSKTAELINQWRGSPDVDAVSSKKPGHNMGTSAIVWLRITKKGNQFHGYFKEEETSNWISFGEVPMINFSTPSRFFVGLAVTSHDQTKLVALDASNLEIKELAPPPPTKSPTRHPTKSPTRHPTKSPTRNPTKSPSHKG